MRLLSILLLALLLAGCKSKKQDPYIDAISAQRLKDIRATMRTISQTSIDVNENPLADSEQGWAWNTVVSWPEKDSYKVEYVMYTNDINKRLTNRTERVEYRHNCVETRWGKFYFSEDDGWNRGTDWMRVAVDVDGVDQVREPGRWWCVIREELNRMYAALDSMRHDRAVRDSVERSRHDSIRLFKLDSAMKSIGR